MSDLSVQPLDDQQLVELTRGGDRLAFSQLFERHHVEIYHLAYRLTRDREVAADVAQEAWIRAWKGLSGFRGEAAFGTWIYRIAVNVAATARHRERRFQTSDLSEMPEPEVPFSAHPDRILERTELDHDLARALGLLSPGARTVVVMKDVHGWTHQEIADALSISVTSAKVRLHRAHQRLQKLLRRGRS